MWIMTPYGILMPARRPAETIANDDVKTMQVRARDRRALVELVKRMSTRIDENSISEIIATPDMDYNYRIYCEPEAFAQLMKFEIEEIDYEKFKPETLYDDLHTLYNFIWSVVFTHYERRGAKNARKRKSRKQ
jgi:ferredoxin-NADP reductase